MMLDLTQVQGFVAVAEELHFGRAARRLNLTPSPLSRQVQTLEHTLGVALLDRTSRSVCLTLAGQAFLEEARRLLEGARNAEQVARQVGRGEAGPVRLGYTAASALVVLPLLVAEVHAALPGIDLMLEEMVTAEQMDALAVGQLDLGLIRPPGPALHAGGTRVAMATLLREKLLLAVPEGHFLQGRSEASLADLDAQSFVTWSPRGGGYFLGLLATMFRVSGVMPRVVQRVNQTHTMLALVRAGMGLALVPESARVLQIEGVALLPLRAEPEPQVELLLAWREMDSNPALPIIRSILISKHHPRNDLFEPKTTPNLNG